MPKLFTMERIDAIYARQSADRADSISIESQIEFCTYETHGGPHQIYADRGYSGKNTERPEFQRMLEDIKAGAIRRVICYKLDRCSRSILDFTSLMEFFQQHAVEFISCTEKFDTSSPMGRAMLNICIVFAQLERETIQQRVYDAYHARCKHGFYMGGRIPFGYQLQPHRIENKKTACYVPDPVEAPLLQKLYGLYAVSSCSLSDVCRYMHGQKLENPRRADGLWIRSHVGRLLRNPIYVKADLAVYYFFQEKGIQIHNPPADFIGINGCYLYEDKADHTKLLVLAPHEGIVDSRTWLSCRKKGRAETEYQQTGVKYSWLSGRIKCGICGYAMIVRKVRNQACFRCSMNVESKEHCHGVGSFPVEQVENSILPGLKRKLNMLALFPIQACKKWDKDQARIHIQIASLEEESAALVRKLPDANPTVYAYIQNRLETIRDELRSYLQQLEKVCKPDDADRKPQDYACLWDAMPLKEKLKIAHLLIRRITVHTDKICVEWTL